MVVISSLVAGTHGRAVQMHGAGATLGDTATVFGAYESERVTQGPQERSGGIDFPQVHGLSVYSQSCHNNSPLLMKLMAVEPDEYSDEKTGTFVRKSASK